jgi:hypothetical protein
MPRCKCSLKHSSACMSHRLTPSQPPTAQVVLSSGLTSLAGVLPRSLAFSMRRIHHRCSLRISSHLLIGSAFVVSLNPNAFIKHHQTASDPSCCLYLLLFFFHISASPSVTPTLSCHLLVAVSSVPIAFHLTAPKPQPKPTHQSKNIVHTLTNPISVLFSRKHCRQMFNPYFLIRPALCVHTRQPRAPLPNWRGRENQTDSWDILREFAGGADVVW